MLLLPNSVEIIGFIKSKSKITYNPSLLYALLILFLSMLFVGVCKKPEEGAMIATVFLYYLAPTLTVIGILILGLPSYLLFKKKKMKKYLIPFYFGSLGAIIIWIETIVVLCTLYSKYIFPNVLITGENCCV